MFERFTDAARQTVVQAQEQARLHNHNYIGVEHLLLGLAGQSGTAAAAVLADAGVTREAATDGLAALVPDGARTVGGHIPFTPGAKRALENALRESLRLAQAFIGPEQLLLGVLSQAAEAGGVVGELLGRLGVPPEQLRQAVLAQLPPGDETTVGPEPPLSFSAHMQGALTRAAAVSTGQLQTLGLVVEILADGGAGATHALTQAGVDVDGLILVLGKAAAAGASED
jgi:ATP-dependent Clp protease ATP-binding subunit ClpC